VSTFSLTEDQRQRFLNDGYFIAERLFDPEEIDLLGKIARADHRLDQEAVSRRDAHGGAIRLRVENEIHDDIYGAIVRSRRIVETMEQLLGGEVYHYHHKMILKEPFTGGAWEWHQDYGYWYNNGCLYPLLASCMIAVDRATEENGCLQVLKGSHHLGRIDHGKTGDQTGADLERVEAARERLETVHCTLEPGSAIFFHCNLLHCSAQNKSANPRWAFICCYNAKRNNPYIDSRHPRYTPMQTLPDEAVKEVGRRQITQMG
jgi:ectoine hydroxylase